MTMQLVESYASTDGGAPPEDPIPASDPHHEPSTSTRPDDMNTPDEWVKR
jgi:hypothetical protein